MAIIGNIPYFQTNPNDNDNDENDNDENDDIFNTW